MNNSIRNCLLSLSVTAWMLVSLPITGWAQAASRPATGVPFEDLMAKIVQNYSLGRMAEESEVAAVAVFLASDESSAITGQTIVSHCGQHIVH